MPGARLLCLCEGVGWMGVLVAFCKGIFFCLVFLRCVGWGAFMLLSLPTLAMAGAQLWRTLSLLACFRGLCVVKLLWLKAAHWTQGGTKQQRIQFRLLLPLTCSAKAWQATVRKGQSFLRGGPKAGVSVPERQICLPLPSFLPHAQWTLDPLPHWAPEAVAHDFQQEWCLAKPSQRCLSLQKEPSFSENGNRHYLFVSLKPS